jgi:DNA-binding CsgD family transcriptional regulator
MTGITAARAAAARSVGRLCRGWSESSELLQKVGNLIGTVVPHDTRDWQLYDPQAMVPVAAVFDHPVPFAIRLAHCEIEQAGGEPDAFRRLARSRRPVTTLARATMGEPGSSQRFRELLAPAGIRHELRAALVHQGSCWGTLILSREDGPDFSGEELRWVHGITGHVASALKHRLISAPPVSGQRIAAPPPGVITLRAGGSPVASTAPAQQWLDILADETGWGYVPQLALHSASVAARLQDPGRAASLHLPTALGWVSIHAATDLHSDQITIIVQRARSEAMIPILARAYGLTSSERAVVALVMRGLSSREISDRLVITTDTVHDHLKAVYRKTGTSGRGALRHRLALDTWAQAHSDEAPGLLPPAAQDTSTEAGDGYRGKLSRMPG